MPSIRLWAIRGLFCIRPRNCSLGITITVQGSLATTVALRFASEHGHGAEDLVLLYIADFLAIHQRFGVPFDDDEYMIRIVALADQRLARGEVAEAGGRADFRLLQVRQRIAEQGSLSDQVLQ